MPTVEFGKAFKEYGGDIILLADRFGVSYSAASVRAKALGLGKP